MSDAATAAPPLRARLAMFTRLLAIQGAWNYELLVGNGIGFCAEPALRALKQRHDGKAYHEALARQSRYFNAHPYLAAIAVGALTRAELDGLPAAQIERFRTALPGPLGSVGDRLVWAGWLPLCSLLALLAFALGASGAAVVIGFLSLYNIGHLALRAWGLDVGLRHGLRIATALGSPVFRRGPAYVARAVALLAGVTVPLVLARLLAPGRWRFTSLLGDAAVAGAEAGSSAETVVGVTLALAALTAVLLVRLHGRVQGWRVALIVLAGYLALASVVALP